MASIRCEIDHQSGIPLGGIGTGTIEIRPDGHFHEGQIFNRGPWAKESGEAGSAEGPTPGPGTLLFFLRCQRAGGSPQVRRLGRRSDQHDLYHLPWLRSVSAIEFEGRYPVARLRYVDPSLPLSLGACMFSPFVAHQAQHSATPGFYSSFELANRSEDHLELSLLAVLENGTSRSPSTRPSS